MTETQIQLANKASCLSRDGSTLAIHDTTHVFLYVQNANHQWTLQKTLNAPATLLSGTVSLSESGNVLAVGLDLYTRQGILWTYRTSVHTDSDIPPSVVVLSDDGNFCLVGVPDLINEVMSKVYVFTTQGQRIQEYTDFRTRRLGVSVAISHDNSQIIAGNPAPAYYNFVNSVFLSAFPYTNITYLDGAQNTATFGASVAINEDGTLVVVGEPESDLVHIYTRTLGTNWQQMTILHPVDASGHAGFGTSLSLSLDGSVLAIGGPQDNNGIGAVWIYQQVSTVWTAYPKITRSSTSGSMGQSVSLSGNGSLLIVSGADVVWLFDVHSLETTSTRSLTIDRALHAAPPKDAAYSKVYVQPLRESIASMASFAHPMAPARDVIYHHVVIGKNYAFGLVAKDARWNHFSL